jgi:hypothetical protein
MAEQARHYAAFCSAQRSHLVAVSGAIYPVKAGRAVAGAVVVGTAITASAFQSLSCPVTPVVMGGDIYYQCGSTRYPPAYQGSQEVYVVVNPPQ